MTAAETSVREVRRENDWAPDEPGELVGFLLPADEHQWVPATVFGAASARRLTSVLPSRSFVSTVYRRWLTGGRSGSVATSGARPGCSR